MLNIDLKVGESVSIGGAIVTLEHKSGQVARLAIHADNSIKVTRIAPQTAARMAAEHGITVAA